MASILTSNAEITGALSEPNSPVLSFVQDELNSGQVMLKLVHDRQNMNGNSYI